jgi:hypothetical protein
VTANQGGLKAGLSDPVAWSCHDFTRPRRIS